MKKQLWLHIGLHKTGSTYIQTMAANNAKYLANHGIYFRPPDGPISGNYDEAWALQQGNLEPALNYARNGFASGAKTVLLSAEDLETILVRRRNAVRLTHEIRRRFQADTIVAVYLRRPSEQFWSLVNQVSRHAYFDVFQLLSEALRAGYIRIPNPVPGEFFAPEWTFVLDHRGFINQFRTRVPEVPVLAFDFDDGSYPGQQMFRALGLNVDDLETPEDGVINPSNTMSIVQQSLLQHISSVLPANKASKKVQEEIESRVRLSDETEKAISTIVDHRFLTGSRSILQERASLVEI